MTLSVDEVIRVANLARLSLSPAESSEMAGQLSKIVDLVNELSGLDTEGVEPLVHAIEISNVLAEDETRPSLPRESVLQNAPASDDECFRVPAVLG